VDRTRSITSSARADSGTALPTSSRSTGPPCNFSGDRRQIAGSARQPRLIDPRTPSAPSSASARVTRTSPSTDSEIHNRAAAGPRCAGVPRRAFAISRAPPSRGRGPPACGRIAVTMMEQLSSRNRLQRVRNAQTVAQADRTVVSRPCAYVAPTSVKGLEFDAHVAQRPFPDHESARNFLKRG